VYKLLTYLEALAVSLSLRLFVRLFVTYLQPPLVRPVRCQRNSDLGQFRMLYSEIDTYDAALCISSTWMTFGI